MESWRTCVNIDEKGGGINICIINENTGENLGWKRLESKESKENISNAWIEQVDSHLSSLYDLHSLIICYQSAAFEPP